MLISLEEYANKIGRSSRGVRRKAQAGNLPGAVKIGRNWLIDSEAEYPDYRIKSRKYIKKGSSNMKTWTFENGITVEETTYDYDLHAFEVYNDGELLGTVYPGDLEDMERCIAELDNGNDPITDKWEDGLGNTCTLEGWGK